MVMATAYVAAAMITMVALIVLFAVGTVIGGTVLSVKALLWLLQTQRPRARRLPVSIRQTALATDAQEAQLLATSVLHRLFEDALSVDPSALRRKGRRVLQRVTVESRELARLLGVMEKHPRTDTSADLLAIRRLIDRAEAVAHYARRSTNAHTLRVDQLWLLERERIALARERDLLISELVTWQPGRPAA
jgi:hypothetical protein